MTIHIDIYVSMTQILFARTWKDCKNVKGHGTKVDVALIIATKELVSYTTEMWHLCLPGNEHHKQV